METIEKATKKALITALIFTALLVVGIPLIPVGAVNRLWAVMAIGIVCTVVGFYGTPVVWVGYGNKCALKRLVCAVTVEHLYTVQELSEQLGKRPRAIRGMLDACFAKRYITGFRRNGDELTLNDRAALADALKPAECPYCGAKFSYKGTEPVCPYCRSLIEKK